MILKQLRLLGLSFGLGLLVLAACQQDQESLTQKDTPSQKEPPLTFLTSPWPPDALSYVAQEKGFFKKHGVKVELVWADGYEEIFQQFESGKLDVISLTLLDAVNYRATTGVGEVIFMQDISAGADAVVTLSPEIRTLADLKGKKVGVERDTVGEFFLTVLLEREGLSLEDLEMVDVASEKIVDHLRRGKIEAGVCYAPCPTHALYAGGSILVDSAKEKNLIVDVYMVKADHFQEHKQTYAKAFTALVEAGEFFNRHPGESADLMRTILNLPPEDILLAMRGLRISTLQDNQMAFNRNVGFSSLYNLVKLAAQHLERQRVIPDDFDPDLLINPHLMEAMER